MILVVVGCDGALNPTPPVPPGTPLAGSFGPVVTGATPPPPPVSGGTLRVLSDGSAAIAADPDRDQVSIVDLATRSLRAQIQLLPGDEPGRIVEDDGGRVHVALRRGGAIVTIDPVAGVVTMRRSICPTLEDLFGSCGSKSHGVAPALTSDQVEDLIAFLETR